MGNPVPDVDGLTVWAGFERIFGVFGRFKESLRCWMVIGRVWMALGFALVHDMSPVNDRVRVCENMSRPLFHYF